MDKRDIWLWIALFTEGRTDIIKSIIKDSVEVHELYYSDMDRLISVLGITEKEATFIINARNKFDIEKEKQQLNNKNIKFVCVEDEEYPDKLRKYNDIPYFLFYKGNLPKNYMPTVGMIGARACSNYGKNIAGNIAKELSANGVQIISGMARGIDTYSQLGAIQGGTSTFAILGCGVDICYPAENIELYERILATGGGIISEYPCGTKPLGWHFPMRNRIISGMSDKIAVIEAKEQSGSLITVEWALEQGKDVFAVPGSVNDALSKGCNRLIKSGAGVLTEASDILTDLNFDIKSFIKIKKMNEKCLEKDLLLVYSELGLYPKSVHNLIEETQLKYEKIMEILFKLQLLGLVEETYKGYYARKNGT